MIGQLPDSFIDRITDIFLPRILTSEDRKTLCLDAYLTTHRWLLSHMQLSGTPRQFIIQALNTFIQYGPYLAEPLFTAMRSSYGDAAEVARHLAEFQTVAARLAPVDQQEVQAATQQLELPALYLIHSDRDRALAQQVAKRLEQHGRPCHLGSSLQKGSDRWLADVGAALSQAYGVVCLVGSQTAQDRLAQVELLAAQDKRKPLVALQLPDTPLPPALEGTVPLFPWSDDGTLSVAMLNALPPQPGEPTIPADDMLLSPTLLIRADELRYMDSLRLAVLLHVGQYTRLSGQTRFGRSRSDRLQLNPVVARTEFHYAPWRQDADHLETAPQQPFEDAVTELKAIRRAVLLGDPGSGKTSTLYKLAADLIDTALLDRSDPIPLLVRLGQWTDADASLPDFLRHSLGEIGEGLAERLAQGRIALLLDGLNEIPSGQQVEKYRQVGQFLAQYPDLMAIVTCREQDYPPERSLTLDRITVAPLDAVRIHEFVCNYLNHADSARDDEDGGDDLFWKLAGEAAVETYQRFIEAVGTRLADPFGTFWLARTLPDGLLWGHKNYYWKAWLKNRAHSASLLLLANNPYMLFMLLDVYQAYGQNLPANRGQLFDWFTSILLRRERVEGTVRDGLLQALSELAFAMQRQSQGEGTTALIALPQTAITPYLDTWQQYRAVSANLLSINEKVRFSHQLLQEYFVALALRERIWDGENAQHVDTKAMRVKATDIWRPDRWWQPTNWEEATILLAGLFSDDCMPVLEWLVDAQPELAARCIMESGAYTSDETKLRLRDRWLPRLTDLKRDPDARARAAVGRALGRLSLADGTPLDDRPGVGLVVRSGWQLPNIDWGNTVPVGMYTIGGDKDAFQSFDETQVQIGQPFQLARYPVTYAQFHCFITASDVAEPRWWVGMPEEEEVYGTLYRLQEWREQAFKYWNHPREGVSWYQAIAFCRWLSDKLEYAVDLPHEYEWEVAVRYPDCRFYPWGNEFDATKANTNEGNRIGLTSAVGIYPQGGNKILRLDEMSGNVYEWCRNKYDSRLENLEYLKIGTRVVRGGAWTHEHVYARSAFRTLGRPASCTNNNGFRVVRRPLSHPDD